MEAKGRDPAEHTPPVQDGIAVHVVINPRSGNGRGLRLRDRIERHLARRGLLVEVTITAGPGHATALAESAASGRADVIVAVGGDGTAHEVANGILRAGATANGTTPALAVVPVGSGNDFAKVLGVHGSVDAAIDAISTGSVRRFDVGHATWQGGSAYFVNAMGTGIDVEVVRQIERSSRLPGTFNYVVGLVRALARYHAVPINVQAGASSFSGKIMTIAVANGRCVGGTFHICPGSQPDDGLFDVCVIRELSLLRSLATAARIIRGKHVTDPAVLMFRSDTVDIEVPQEVSFFFQLDGELHEPPAVRSIRLSILRGALPVRTRRRA